MPSQIPSESQLVPQDLARILEGTPGLEQAYLVGGCVRDWLLGCAIKDCDIEVFGIDYHRLSTALSRWGKTDLVGRSFGVVKLTLPNGPTFDFTIPRRDSKVSPGHKGFDVTFDPSISPEEAAARRDFTINSLMFDPRRKQLLDFFGGENDLRNGILRHTSAAFVEDPLRVLRGMQFAARFNLRTDAKTIDFCRSIKASYTELPSERVRDEWFKWAAKSRVPSAGLRFLAETEWLDHFPELKALRGTPQDPGWHPEGDVFVHTAHCSDALVELPEWKAADEETRIVLSFVILTHDFGKATSTHTSMQDGEMRIVSPGHDEASVPLAESFLARFRTPNAIVERVVPLVRAHMSHLHEVTDRSVRRLSKRLEPESIEHLCIVMTADAFGRPPRPKKVPKVVEALQSRAAELKVHSEAPKALLLGRHLLQLGMRASPEMGQLLKRAYDAQLEGKFFTVAAAMKWLAEETASESPELALAAKAEGDALSK
jgi:tRNA nucleotidyltransferase (CCA-adding enzyme)